MKVLVLGAGFGGLALASRLSEVLGDDVEVTLIDKGDGFVFGFSKLDVMFGRRTADSVLHPYADILKPGVCFVQTDIQLDRPGRAARRDRAGCVRGRGDGRRARRRPAPGGDARAPRGGPRVLHGGGRLRRSRRPRRLRRRARRHRRHVDAVQVPAGAERDGAADARLPHRAGTPRALGDRPRDAAAGTDPAVTRRVEGDPRGVRGAGHRVAPQPPRAASSTRPGVSPASRTAARCRSTCSSACRPTACRTSSPSRGCASTAGSPSTRSPSPPAGRASTRSATSRASAPRRRASSPKVRPPSSPSRSSPAPAAGAHAGYDGRGVCYLELGSEGVAVVDVTFVAGQAPFGSLNGPSPELTAEKSAFGTTRIKRWFDRDW